MSSKGRRAQMGSVAVVGAIFPVFESFGLTVGRKLRGGLCRSLVWAALLVGLCQAGQAQEAPGAAPSTTSTGGAVTLFQNVRIFDGRSSTLSGPRNVLVRGNQIERISAGPIPTDRSADHRAHRRRRAHPDARADRHALAHDAGAADAGGAAHGGHRSPQSRGGRRGDGHADARVHHRSRHGWTVVRTQARHRRGHRLPARASSRPAPSSPSPVVTATSASHTNCRERSAHPQSRGELTRSRHDRGQSG